MTQTATSPRRKPLLDEASFQQLLTAAYVLQEHNDRLRGKEVHADFAKNLSAIVETQKLIQTLQLDLEAATKLVAERVRQISGASGAAIGIIEKGELVYRAANGIAAADAGTRVAPASSLSADSLSQGSAVSYPDASAIAQPRAELFREREVKSFIAVPVYHAGQVAGVLELRFAKANSFREADLRTAELMAGLLSEAMATAARMKWKDALVSERQSMLEALERIKPQLERLGSESSPENLVERRPAETRFELPTSTKSEVFATREACSVCGSEFVDRGESFCGICGTARPISSSAPYGAETGSRSGSPVITPYGADAPSNGNSRLDAAAMPTKSEPLPASLQELIELSAIQQNAVTQFERHFEKRETPKATQNSSIAVVPEPSVRPESDFFARPSETRSAPAAPEYPNSVSVPPAGPFAPPVENATAVANGGESLRIVPVDIAPANLVPADMGPGSLVPADAGGQSRELQVAPWGSARKTQQWLETVKAQRGPTAEWVAHQWQTRRANIYIGLAAVILVAVISGWGMRPSSTAIAGNASPATTTRHQAPPAPNLTPFEKLMVNLGLAEAPPAPVYMGNPDTQVWVDVHTALYHCPGSDLFGKTADGRMSTQREAQQDQFEPANRKACP